MNSCDDAIDVLRYIDNELSGPELEAVVLRYQLPLPPLWQRPQLQIYARMPAQCA